MAVGAKAFLILAMLGIGSAETAEQPDHVNHVPEFACSSGPHRLKLPKSYSSVRRLGKLKRETVTRTEDWDGYKAQERELVFEGLRLLVITFTNDRDRYIIAAADITDRRWNLVDGFRVGDTIDKARAKLAAASNANADTLEFGGDTDVVLFKVSGGRVTAISYDCYTG
jgi:hypothetical protein